jgi:hypothetical protein
LLILHDTRLGPWAFGPETDASYIVRRRVSWQAGRKSWHAKSGLHASLAGEGSAVDIFTAVQGRLTTELRRQPQSLDARLGFHFIIAYRKYLANVKSLEGCFNGNCVLVFLY